MEVCNDFDCYLRLTNAFVVCISFVSDNIVRNLKYFNFCLIIFCCLRERDKLKNNFELKFLPTVKDAKIKKKRFNVMWK